jgi:hypothetical protein
MNGILFNVTDTSSISRSAGVYRIAHFLREHGADIEVVDWANHWSLTELQELFVSRYNSKLKYIGFSHLFSTWSEVLEDFCKWVKENYPTVKILSGSSSKPWFKSKYIDFYVAGFGEYAVLELVKYIDGNGPRPRFSLELANGKPLIDANAAYTAYPMKSLMIKYEDRDFLQENEWIGIETARGCKFQCAFCNFPVLGVKGDHTRDADDFEIHLRDVYDRYGVSKFVIADETFNDRTEKITKFADVVEKLNFSPWFSGFIRADLLHSRKGDIPELARMRFGGHYYGIESFNTASARAVGKGLDSEKIKKALLETKQYFKNVSTPYRGCVSLIIGLPHESVESIHQTQQWLIDNWQDQSYYAFSLTIPTEASNNNSSLIGKNYEKYGYRKLTTNEINSAEFNEKLSGAYASLDGNMLWANDHMTVFEAQDLAQEFVKMRQDYNFRSDSFRIATRSRFTKVEERLALRYREFEDSADKDISWYINAKLSYK